MGCKSKFHPINETEHLMRGFIALGPCGALVCVVCGLAISLPIVRAMLALVEWFLSLLGFFVTLTSTYISLPRKLLLQFTGLKNRAFFIFCKKICKLAGFLVLLLVGTCGFNNGKYYTYERA